MGQQVAVIEKPSPRPGVLRFEANRNLTGMGHERFTAADQAVGPRPAAAIARQLLDTGQIDSVHIFGNIITVDISKGCTSDGLADLVRNMYQYWKPGMEPPAFADPEPEAAAPAAEGGGDAAGGADSEYLRLVPPILVERSRAALAKWKAEHG